MHPLFLTVSSIDVIDSRMNEYVCSDTCRQSLTVRFRSSIDYGPISVIPNSSNNTFDGVEIYYTYRPHLFVKYYLAIARHCLCDDGFNNGQKHRLGFFRYLDNKNVKELTIERVFLQLDWPIPVPRILVKILIILECLSDGK